MSASQSHWRKPPAQAAGSSGSSRLAAFGRLFRSRYDADIFRLAIPALMSILLDPVMSLVDTGMHDQCLLLQAVELANPVILPCISGLVVPVAYCIDCNPCVPPESFAIKLPGLPGSHSCNMDLFKLGPSQ